MFKRTRKFLALFFGLLALAQPSVILAQDNVALAKPLFPDQFRESFDEYGPTATKDIVGVTLGTVAGTFAPSEFKIVIPSEATTAIDTLCVQVTTIDARFHAENPYQLSVNQTPTLTRIDPVTQTFSDELKSYDLGQFALRAVLSGDPQCLAEETLLIPQVADVSDVLTVWLNARDRYAMLTARRANDTLYVDELVCERVAGEARIAYDRKCVLSVTGISDETLSLEISLDDGFSATPFLARVYIPPRASL